MRPDESTTHEPSVHLTVTIATTDAPGGDPEEAWIAEFDVSETERQAVEREARALVTGEQHKPHVFRYQGGHTSWGAAGLEFHDLFIYVANHAVDAGFGAGAAALIASLSKRFGLRGDHASDRPLSRDEAVSRARFAVVRALRVADRLGPIDPDMLELVKEEHDVHLGRWSVSFRVPGRGVFEVQLQLVEGLPSVVLTRYDHEEAG